MTALGGAQARIGPGAKPKQGKAIEIQTRRATAGNAKQETHEADSKQADNKPKTKQGKARQGKARKPRSSNPQTNKKSFESAKPAATCPESNLLLVHLIHGSTLV